MYNIVLLFSKLKNTNKKKNHYAGLNLEVVRLVRRQSKLMPTLTLRL